MNQWNNKILANPINKEPKAIFGEYCKELGMHFENIKFKYSKSRPRIEREADGIVESINFWSSKVNEKNDFVLLEILPYVSSKLLKKRIKLTGIGRNEYIYAPIVDYPRTINIFGHSKCDFDELIKQININIISKLEDFKASIMDLELLLENNNFDKEIIADNFLAYVGMKNPELIDKAILKFGNKVSDEYKNKICALKTN